MKAIFDCLEAVDDDFSALLVLCLLYAIADNSGKNIISLLLASAFCELSRITQLQYYSIYFVLPVLMFNA